jgi:hypothetical protein
MKMSQFSDIYPGIGSDFPPNIALDRVFDCGQVKLLRCRDYCSSNKVSIPEA